MEINTLDLKLLRMFHEKQFKGVKIDEIAAELDIKNPNIIQERINKLSDKGLIIFNDKNNLFVGRNTFTDGPDDNNNLFVNHNDLVTGERYEITPKGENILIDYENDLSAKKAEELRTKLLYPIICSVLSALIFFFIGLFTGIHLK